jgi:hypothetical protein
MVVARRRIFWDVSQNFAVSRHFFGKRSFGAVLAPQRKYDLLEKEKV